MCIGIPMQVVESRPDGALCAAADGTHLIDTALVGDVAPGTWLMVFLGAARETISEEAARQTGDALEALRRVLAGDHDIDHLFADLEGREPQLPEHLRDSHDAPVASGDDTASNDSRAIPATPDAGA